MREKLRTIAYAIIANKREDHPTIDVRSVHKDVRRLLVVVNDPSLFLSHRRTLALAARDQGFEVHVAAPRGADESAIRSDGFLLHTIRLHRRGLNPIREVQAFLDLLSVCRETRPNVVHNVTIKAVVYGGLAARALGVPLVINEISGLGYLFIAQGVAAACLRAVVLPLYRLACGHARCRVLCQNRDDVIELGRRGVGRGATTHVISGATQNLSKFIRVPEPEGDPIVILPGRMLADKGVREFVAASCSLRSQGVKARFALVGDTDPGNPAAIVPEQLKRWQDEGSIEWWGYRSDMSEVMKGAHIICLPSYREGFPRVLIEAAASGRPAVATDVPGCRDVVQHGRTGFLVPARDARALADRLHQLITSPDLRESFGQNASDLAQREFSGLDAIARTLRLYEDGRESRGAP